MNLGIVKKVIFFPFFFINFIEPSHSADFLKINKSENYFPSKIIWTKISNKKVNVKFDTTKPEGDKDRTGNIEKAKNFNIKNSPALIYNENWSKILEYI